MTRYAQRTLIQQPTVSNWGKAAPTGIGVVDGYGTASGGTATTVSSVNYQYVAITSTGSFTPTASGLFDVLLFAGGGAGGNGQSGSNRGGGGGGAGCVIQATMFLPASAVTVTIGAGGTGNSSGGTGFEGSLSTLGTNLLSSEVKKLCVVSHCF